MKTRSILAVVAAGALVAGCFGGGGDSPALTPADDPLAVVPADTATSIGATVDYQNRLAALSTPAESREPIDVSGLTLASSETAEPVVVSN